MRRFEFDDRRSRKFWEVDLRGTTLEIRYGRLQTDGRLVVKKFTTPALAKRAHDQAIAEKSRKGYREVSVTRGQTAGRQPAPVATLPKGRILCDDIYREAVRLGAQIGPRRDLPRSVKRCPGFIAEFYEHIIWPKRAAYDAPSIEPVELELVSFGAPQAVPSDYSIQGSKGMDLFGIGMYSGGGWLLLLDGNDKQPGDPLVYSVDHEIPEESLEKRCRLSRFLKKLVVNPKY